MNRRNRAFFLVVVLVVVVVAANTMLLINAKVQQSARATATTSMLGNLRVYPPDAETTEIDGLDKPSETLYFYLSGQEVSSPDPEKREALRKQRKGKTVYTDFRISDLADYDGDGNYEIVDYFGNPWIYVRGPSAGKEKAAQMGDPDNGYRPWHRRNSYDIFSAGADGKTGTNWTPHPDMLKLGPSDENSFYRQATDEYEDGLRGAGGYSADDIANF